MPEKVRCVNCGFLAARKLATRELVEAEDSFRESMELPSYGNATIYDDKPLCFVAANDLVAEARALPPGTELRKRYVDAMQRERDCCGFTKRQHGFTPKEHAEMIQQAEFQRLQDEREDSAQQFQAEQAKLAHERHIQSLCTSAAVAFVGAIITAAATLFAVRMTPAPRAESPPAVATANPPAVDAAPAP